MINHFRPISECSNIFSFFCLFNSLSVIYQKNYRCAFIRSNIWTEFLISCTQKGKILDSITSWCSCLSSRNTYIIFWRGFLVLPGAVDLVHVHMASPHLPFSAGERERWGIRERPRETRWGQSVPQAWGVPVCGVKQHGSFRGRERTNANVPHQKLVESLSVG